MKLKELRKSKGYTQEQLAKESGTTKYQISHIENGKRNITPELKEKITRILGKFDEETKVKFSKYEALKIIGEIYGYLNQKLKGTDKEIIKAVENPTKELMQIYKKTVLLLTKDEEKWITSVIDKIDYNNYLSSEKTTTEKEQSAFLYGYYKGLKK